jgi:pyrroline-5-carboxylate reductase
MQIGLIGAGNIAGAFARGWGAGLLFADALVQRARRLAEETGGEAVASNVELAERADLVMLCHKPPQLEEVAAEIAGRAKAVASVLAGRTVADLQAAYPDTPVFRFMPNVAVQVRAGVIGYTPADGVDPELEQRVLERFGEIGRVFTVSEPQLEVVTATAGVGPAYVSLVAEAQVDAAVRSGLPSDLASELVAATMAGSVALLQARGNDTLAVRRSVTSPGGVTARGLAALERGGLRTAFHDAMDAALGKESR